ncbi:MAG: hypothetical protein ACOYOK_09005 [Pseudobdellovibrionaceae bacterium]
MLKKILLKIAFVFVYLINVSTQTFLFTTMPLSYAEADNEPKKINLDVNMNPKLSDDTATDFSILDQESKKPYMRVQASSEKLDSDTIHPKNYEDLLRVLQKIELAVKSSTKKIQETTNNTKENIKHSHFVATKTLTAKNFSTELGMFLVVMGGLATFHLTTNPLALKQSVDQQISAIGILGLSSFMYTQSFTSNYLFAISKNPALIKQIPYIGMAAGMFAQSLLSEGLSDPHVWSCAKNWLNKTSDNQDCAKAYESLVTTKQIWKHAPSLLSMYISARLAAELERRATSTLVGSFAKIKNFGFLLTWSPVGGLQAKGVKLVLNLASKTAKFATFVSIDMVTQKFGGALWSNLVTSKALEKEQLVLNKSFQEASEHDWKVSEKNKKYLENLKEFNYTLNMWKQFQMTETYESYYGWSDYLNRILAVYKNAYIFYDFIAGQLKILKNEGYQSANAHLGKTYPYYGVKLGTNLLDSNSEFVKDGTVFLNSPQLIEKMQKIEVLHFVDELESAFFKNNSQFTTAPRFNELKEIIALIRSEDSNKSGFGLSKLLEYQKKYVIAVDTREKLSPLLLKLGPIQPLLSRGQGYIEYYSKGQKTQAQFNEMKTVLEWGLERPQDYFLQQMVCGPEASKNSLLRKSSLGQADFIPPSIALNKNESFCGRLQSNAQQILNGMAGLSDSSVLFSYTEKHNNIHGVVDYLFKYLDPSVLDFESWWKNNVSNQLTTEFNEYEKRYRSIIADFIIKLQKKDSSLTKKNDWSFDTVGAFFYNSGAFLNTGSWPNGILAIHEKEMIHALNHLNNILVQMQNMVISNDTIAKSNPHLKVPAYFSTKDLNASAKYLNELKDNANRLIQLMSAIKVSNSNNSISFNQKDYLAIQQEIMVNLGELKNISDNNPSSSVTEVYNALLFQIETSVMSLQTYAQIIQAVSVAKTVLNPTLDEDDKAMAQRIKMIESY